MDDSKKEVTVIAEEMILHWRCGCGYFNSSSFKRDAQPGGAPFYFFKCDACKNTTNVTTP
jgi:hypothetical protein